MTVCSLCQRQIDEAHSLRVDNLYGALGEMHDGTVEGSPEGAYALAAYRALGGLRLLPSYGRQFRPYGNPPTWAHEGCFADWAHDRWQEGPAAGDVDPDIEDMRQADADRVNDMIAEAALGEE